MLIDSHCHLHFDGYKDDLLLVLERAKDAEVKALLTVSTALDDLPKILNLIDTYPQIYGSIGIHPHETDHTPIDELRKVVLEHAKHPKIWALGETGLDFYYEHSSRETQIPLFDAHLALSLETNLPVIIHTRNADDDTISTLKLHPSVRGVFHCFSGSKDFAKQALDLGFYLSFSGIITFQKAQDLRDVVEYVPLDRILIETDSPFLAPVPYRGKRNEPAYVQQVAETMANLKKLSIEEIAHITTENFYSLFQK